MMYSCALFETELQAAEPVDNELSKFNPEKLSFLGSLEEAQRRKVDALLDRLGNVGPENTLLDIGICLYDDISYTEPIGSHVIFCMYIRIWLGRYLYSGC